MHLYIKNNVALQNYRYIFLLTFSQMILNIS